MSEKENKLKVVHHSQDDMRGQTPHQASLLDQDTWNGIWETLSWQNLPGLSIG